MARNGEDNNIVSFDGARRFVSRGAQGGVTARPSRSGRVAPREPYGLDSSEDLPEFAHDPFARASKISRSGRVTPLRGASNAQRVPESASQRAAARASRSGEISASKKRDAQVFAPEEYDEGSYAVTTRKAASSSGHVRVRSRSHAAAAHAGTARHGVADAQVISRPPRASSPQLNASASRFAIDRRDLASLLGEEPASRASSRARTKSHGPQERQRRESESGSRQDRALEGRERRVCEEVRERETLIRDEREHAAQTSRAAVEVFDESDLKDEEETQSAKARRKKKGKAKAKAEKMFMRQFGSDTGAFAQAGSRAAVYKGEMGRKHKRAFADLLDGALSHAPHGVGLPHRSASDGEKRRGIPLKLAIAGAVVACLVLSAAFLYSPAKQFYHETRTHDRLQAEYDALQERNDSIQSSIDHLSTDEGMEDEAREQLGWVEAGETAVHVEGLPEDVVKEKKEAVYVQVANGSIPTPDTWYSAVLDPIFGYVDPSSVSDSFDGKDASNISDKPSAEEKPEKDPAS